MGKKYLALFKSANEGIHTGAFDFFTTVTPPRQLTGVLYAPYASSPASEVSPRHIGSHRREGKCPLYAFRDRGEVVKTFRIYFKKRKKRKI